MVLTSVSNQIVNDLCALADTHLSMCAPVAGLETRSDRRGRIRRVAQPAKIFEFLKEPTGRPYSAPDGGPPEVLLPFLAEDQFELNTLSSLWASPQARPIPNW